MAKVKLFKASPLYDQYLVDFYLAHKEIDSVNYSQQYRLLMDDCYGWADFWKKNLEKIGNYEVFEAVTNAEKLQKQWAQEHGIVYGKESWLQDILEAQIEYFKPDVFFAHDYTNLTVSFRERIRDKFRIKVIIGWDGIAQNNPEVYRGCDLVLTCNENSVEFYRQNGFQSHFFPFAFEASIFDKLQKRKPFHDVVFSGSLFIGKNLHNQRIKFLSQIIQEVNLEVWASGLSRRSFLNPFYLSKKLGLDLSDYRGALKIIFMNHGPVFGLKMYQLLSDSKIVLNFHLDSSGNKAGNMRLFESTGVGSCLITDWKENISDFFEPDKEVVVFKTPGECADKVRYLLNNEPKRKEIAAAGQKKTLEFYGFEKRIKDFASLVFGL